MPIKPSRILSIRSSSLISPTSTIPNSRPISFSSSSSAAAPTTKTLSNPSDPWTYPNALPRVSSTWRSRPENKFPDRKAFQYAYYSHLSNTSPLVLLFEYNHCDTVLLEKIRRGILKIPPPTAPYDPSQAPSPKQKGSGPGPQGTSTKSPAPTPAAPTPTPDLRATFMILRSGVLGAVHRGRPRESSLAPWCDGQRAFIVCPIISGTYLGKVLAVVKKAVKEAQKADVKDAEKQPALNLLVGLVEGNRVVPVSEIEKLLKVPDLDTLRGQVVGMLQGRAQSLVGVLSQAGGGGLVRTLQGLEEGMKEEAKIEA